MGRVHVEVKVNIPGRDGYAYEWYCRADDCLSEDFDPYFFKEDFDALIDEHFHTVRPASSLVVGQPD